MSFTTNAVTAAGDDVSVVSSCRETLALTTPSPLQAAPTSTDGMTDSATSTVVTNASVSRSASAYQVRNDQTRQLRHPACGTATHLRSCCEATWLKSSHLPMPMRTTTPKTPQRELKSTRRRTRTRRQTSSMMMLPPEPWAQQLKLWTMTLLQGQSLVQGQ
jgi:hypothetical protein